MTWYFVSTSTAANSELLKKEVKVVENELYHQLNNSLTQLSRLATYIQQQPNLVHEHFDSFVDDIMHQSESVKAMSWNPLISTQQLNEHQQQLKEIYHRGIKIRGRPISKNDPLVYVKFISPEAENLKAIGFNVYSNPERKKTLDEVKFNYQPKATPLIQLVQSDISEPGFLLFYPVFESIDKGHVSDTRKLRGFATGVFLAEKIVSKAITSYQTCLFKYELYELGKNKVFTSNTDSLTISLDKDPEHFSQLFDIAGQTWGINLVANKEFIVNQQSKSFLLLYILQVAIVTVIMIFLLMMNNRQEVLNAEVEERTESLKKMTETATQANKAKSQFLANMSHEIRTPMNSVVGFARLALNSNSDSEIKDFLEKIAVSSDLLLHIVNDILDISKIESRKLVLDNDIFDLHQSLNRINTIFESEANKKSLSWLLKDELPNNLYYYGDQTRVEQILMNLCGNAIKFTESGTVSLQAMLIENIGDKARLHIKVIDSGIGISNEQAKKLFNPFTQADSSTSRTYGGTGLGLTISRELSRLMEGDISFVSSLGQGSVFTLTMSLPSTMEKVVDEQEAKEVSQDEFSALKILVAEDNRINQKLIKTILLRLSIEANIVENGLLAVKAVQQHEYDLVLMDCQMPVLDGYQATKRIREAENIVQPRIVALTADVDTKSKQHAEQVGMNGHLAKPIDVDKLINELRQCL